MDLDNDGVLDLYTGAFYCKPVLKRAPTLFFKGIKGKPLQFENPIPLETLSGALPDLSTVEHTVDPVTKLKCFRSPHPTRTKPYIADLNDDGNLDLIYGESTGFLIQFNGTSPKGINHFSDKAEILTDVNGDLLKADYWSSPHFADWDGDGDLDLICGTGLGGVFYSQNTGSKEVAQWQPFTEWLPQIAESDPRRGRNAIQNTRDKIQPNSNTTIHVRDYNGDGKLDLLIGDKTILDTPLKNISNEELARKEAEFRAMQDATSDKQPTKEQQEAFRKTFKTSEQVGFVWIYLQK